MSTYLSVAENKKLQSLAVKNKLTVSSYVRKRLGFELLERGRKTDKPKIAQSKSEKAEQIKLFG